VTAVHKRVKSVILIGGSELCCWKLCNQFKLFAID